MSILKLLMLIIEVLCSLLLVVVILLQKTKSQGLGLAFGSGMGETLFGSRAGNVLTKITISLGIVFLVNTLFLGIIFAHSQDARLLSGSGLMGSRKSAPIQRPLPKQPATAPVLPASAPLPEAPVPPGAAPAAQPPAPAPAPAATPAAAPAK